MKDLEINTTDDELESQTLKTQNGTRRRNDDRKPTGDDPIADYLLKTYYMFKQPSMNGVKIGLLVSPLVLILLFYLFVSDSTSNIIAFTALVVSLVFIGISMWMLCWILDKDQGTREMQDISDPIKEGSEGFFITQYGTIFKLALVCAGILFLVYLQRSPASGESKLHLYLGTWSMAFVTSISFLIGANCSALSGYAGIWVSVRANVRVAAAARKCYNEALQICFRGGAFSAIINVALAIFGISFMYLILSFVFYVNQPPGQAHPPIEEIPVVLVGFGFGASFVAMFAQLGGGIYTKAADVGADLIGKVENDIPEDDARNPAVVADLVGDNVGDCAGQCADLFESISAEILSAMILGAEVLAGFLMFATSTGILMALFFNNGGGAWDNAKKYIETGMYGGKGGEAHKAAVTGDTVGDPCKDTAGPSIHILIKLLSTITLVLVPLFSGYGK